MQWSSSRGTKVTSSSSWSWRGIVDEREICCRRCLPAHYLDIVWELGSWWALPEHWDPGLNFSHDRPINSSCQGPSVSPPRDYLCGSIMHWCVLCTAHCPIIWVCLMTSSDAGSRDPVQNQLCSGPGLGWEGHWVTPVKVRVKQTQTAVRADSHGIEIASHRWGDAWENILIGSKIISPWLLTSRNESESTVSLEAVLAAANIFSNLDKHTSVHIYQVLGTDTLTAIIMERVYA